MTIEKQITFHIAFKWTQCIDMVSIKACNVRSKELIIKYGQGFSTLQFLLSPTRESLLDETYLIGTFTALHFGLVMMIYTINWSLSSLFIDKISNRDNIHILNRSIV